MKSLDKKKYISITTYGVIVLIIIGIFVSFEYGDIIITQGHALVFLDLLFQGKIRDFYPYCVQYTDVGATYDATLYIVFAIWNIPTYIFQRITGIEAQTMDFWLIYGKVLIFIGYFGTIYMVRKLYLDMHRVFSNNTKCTMSIVWVFYALSPLLLLYSLYSGNYDVLSLTLMLIGIDALIKRRFKIFIFMFALAASMKYFALIIFVPILLLREKRIPRLILYTVFTLSISIMEKIIFHNSTVSDDYPTSFVMYFLSDSGKLDFFGVGPMSLLLFAYIILCVYCYLQNCEDEYYYYRKIIYVSSFAWIIFFLTVPYYCYWIVFLIPFLVLMIFSTEKNLFINIILEIFFSSSMLMISMMRARHIIGACGRFMMSKRLADYMFGEKNYDWPIHTLGDFLNGYNEVYGFYMFLVAIMIASIFLIVVLNYPGQRVQSLIPEVKVSDRDIKLAICIRNVVSMGWYILPCLYWFAQIIF